MGIQSQIYGHLIHYILTLTITLYDVKICLLSLYQTYGCGEINKQTHSWNSWAKGFQLGGIRWQ